jgi:hypothetical protein
LTYQAFPPRYRTGRALAIEPVKLGVASQALYASERAVFVMAHKTRKADYVSRENGCEAAGWSFLWQPNVVSSMVPRS